jgi:tetratricopeptide (TPR) repeat protein
MNQEEMDRLMKGLQTIQSCKGNTSNLYHMAVTSLKQGKLDLAISCLARVCELGEARALDHFTYAEALRRAGRHEEALAAARRGAAKDPSFAAGWETLGSVYAAAGRLTEALDSFKKAVSLNPRSVIALNNLGLVSQAMGQFKEAEVSYRHALTLAPDNQEIKINLASQQGLSGNPHAGLDLIKEVLERGPANLQALLLGSMLAIEADHYDLCLIWAEKILAIAPGHPTALHHRGLIVSKPRSRPSIRLRSELQSLPPRSQAKPRFSLKRATSKLPLKWCKRRSFRIIISPRRGICARP